MCTSRKRISQNRFGSHWTSGQHQHLVGRVFCDPQGPLKGGLICEGETSESFIGRV
jgi:hypothetical protein